MMTFNRYYAALYRASSREARNQIHHRRFRRGRHSNRHCQDERMHNIFSNKI